MKMKLYAVLLASLLLIITRTSESTYSFNDGQGNSGVIVTS